MFTEGGGGDIIRVFLIPEQIESNDFVIQERVGLGGDDFMETITIFDMPIDAINNGVLIVVVDEYRLRRDAG